ncbi:efflux RND transporter permease subunit [Thalassolituus marinus]|uniref:MMPL family transporter n=1 Tax=Thalassolituus marinus TaxID=671053 RepID=A0ABS7ZWT0_9GAMM|nr:MMPL family transporter [Thalassolituus marinus]MCA6064876.1 MMPL family transporter [Thalassolituus marinus]
MYTALFHYTIKHPWRVIALVLLLLVFCGGGALRLSFTTDFRSYFSPQNPQLQAFDQMEAIYANQDNLYIFLRNPQGSLINQRGLTLIADLTESGWTMPGALRVDSIQNFQFTRATDDDLITDNLYYADQLSDMQPQDFNQLLRDVNNLPEIRGHLLSEDGSASGVNIRIAPDASSDADTMRAIVAEARQRVAELRQQYPEFQILLGGSLLSNITLGEAIGQDLRSLLIISYAVMIALMIFLLRSVSAMALVLAVISFSIVSAMGIAGWLGIPLTPPTGFVPTAIMTIAVADTIHILVSFFYFLRQGQERNSAVMSAMQLNASPVFITSITTIVGVLCLNASDSPPYRDMGNLIAIGVFFAWLFTLTFIPAALTLIPLQAGRFVSSESKLSGRMAEFVIKHQRVLLIAMLLMVAACATQTGQIRITERWHEFFDESFEVRQTTDAIQDHLGGLHLLFFIADSEQENGINDPHYLQQLDDFTQWLRQQPQVAHVSAHSDTIKRLNQNLHADAAEQYRIPPSRELAAQYLLLYEMSLPMGLGLDDSLNNARSATRMQVRLHRTDSESILAMEQSAVRWAQQHAPLLHIKQATGLDIIFANLTFRNIHAMLQGTGFALLMISLLLIAALRSWRMGLISMIPNIMPALMAYGLWVLMDGEIDTATSVVACLCLGIVVDDTVHFLSKYRYARQQLALSAEDAIRYSFHTVGVALFITSLVLVSGFLILEFSHFNPSASMGTLLALSIATALLIDFLLLPPLLLFFERHLRQGLR